MATKRLAFGRATAFSALGLLPSCVDVDGYQLRHSLDEPLYSSGGNATQGGAGASSTGGQKGAGGSSSTGGAGGHANTGGIGGFATGGAKSTGGTTTTLVTAGGVRSTGGAIATGGRFSTGGAVATGGRLLTGGTLATGGALPTGGALATGGAVPTGGTTPSGGAGGFGGSGVAVCQEGALYNPNRAVGCQSSCSIGGVMSANVSYTYDCTCVSGQLICYAGSTTIVACPLTVAEGLPAICNPGSDSDCFLITTTTGTTTTNQYTCQCNPNSQYYDCTGP